MTPESVAKRHETRNGIEFAVADLDAAEFGRKEIRLAEHEMPGLMALRREYAEVYPLRGARVSGSLHMTVQTAVLIETLVALGAEVRWASCNIFSTQDHAAAAVVVGPHGSAEEPKGVPVFAWKGESLEEYWWCTERMLTWDGEGPNMILDDGGDATMLVHKGTEYEKAGVVPTPDEDTSDEFRVFLELLRASVAADTGKWTKIGEGVRGVTEETTTGVLRLYQLAAAGELLFPAINVNDAVTKSKFDNRYGIRHSLIDGINRGTDVLPEADIVITTTGNKDVVLVEHMAQMKHQAILGNIGHFDNELDMAGLARYPGIRRITIKPQVDEWIFPNGRTILVLSEGRLLNLGNATGHPSFVMSNSFSNQVIAQVELFTKYEEYDKEVFRLPKKLDEKVAKIHLDALGGELTKLTKEQAEYIDVDVEGPFKPEHYRY